MRKQRDGDQEETGRQRGDGDKGDTTERRRPRRSQNIDGDNGESQKQREISRQCKQTEKETIVTSRR